jgi:hypothetical protein
VNLDSRADARLSRVLAILAALQMTLAVVGIGWWSWQAFGSEELPDSRPVLAAEVSRPVNLESAFPLAQERALQWRDDAKLILVGAQIDWPLEVPPGPVTEPPGGGWLTYVFLRERPGDDEVLCLLIERYSGKIVQEIVSTWGAPGPVAELDLLNLPISSTTALLTAEAAGGTEYRRACPEARHQTRVSLGQAPLELAELAGGTPPAVPANGGDFAADVDSMGWLLGYRDVRDGGIASFRVGVDVISGEATPNQRSVPDAEGCPA